MIEKTMVSLQVTIPEKEALRRAANKEKRSLSNFLLNAALTRAQEKFGIVPEKGDDDACIGN